MPWLWLIPLWFIGSVLFGIGTGKTFKYADEEDDQR
jgi:hypothetical protein